MAIGSICEHCGAGFSAPDASLGAQVSCPTCTKKTRVLDGDGVREIEERRRQDERRKEDLQSRMELLEELEKWEKTEGVRGGIEESARYFQPRAGSRNRRLRVLGQMMMAIAWFVFALTLGVAVLALVEDDYSNLLAVQAVGLFFFGSLKFLSEVSYTLADMADRQWDIRALLLDMREEQERRHENENS